MAPAVLAAQILLVTLGGSRLKGNPNVICEGCHQLVEGQVRRNLTSPRFGPPYPDRISDVVQEAYAHQLLREGAFDSFRIPEDPAQLQGAFRAWLCGLVKNVCRNAVKSFRKDTRVVPCPRIPESALPDTAERERERGHPGHPPDEPPPSASPEFAVVRSPQGIAPPGLPQIRTCAIRASGSSNHGFAAVRYTECTTRGLGSEYAFKIAVMRSQLMPRPLRRLNQWCQMRFTRSKNCAKAREFPVTP